MNLKRVVVVMALIGLCTFNIAVAGQFKQVPKLVTVTSPNGKTSMQVSALNGMLMYSVNFNKATIIEASRLALVVNGKTIGNKASIGKVENYALNQTYPYRGVHSQAANNYKGSKISVYSGEGSFTLDIRVFNDGVAFRYVVDNKGTATIEKDSTTFTIPAGSTVWSQSNIKYYEGRYGEKKIEEVKSGETAGPPITILLPDTKTYAAVAEGGLTDFGGMSLIADGKRAYIANLTGVTKKVGIIETPWRIVEIGNDLNALVNCDIIANVSPAYDSKLFAKGYATDWIKPGRSVWSWLAGKGPVTLENMKRFTDWAAELGFEYNLVDEGWGRWKDSTRDNFAMMKELVDYSAKKGVKIWVWKAYPDRAGIPGIKDPAKRKEFFKKCKEIGVVGLKVDFFDSEAQEIIDFYQAGLKDAAEFHLMMDFHGANKPTGEARTWPNEMTREAIRGMESRPPWASNNTTLPFTRYLAGHADYTPVHFGDRLGEVSWAHHIASMVVFTSPFLCIAADPQSIIDNPFKETIMGIPSVWDETVVLPQSKIGDLVLYARRTGSTWYLAAMSAAKETKTLTVPLSFLKKGASYKMNIIKDDPAKQANAIQESTNVNRSSAIVIPLNATGGYLGKITIN